MINGPLTHRHHNDAQLLDDGAAFDGSIPVTEEEEANMIPRQPMKFTFDTTSSMSERAINTDRAVIKSTKMKHIEGGWPKEVDFTEKEDVKRFTTKAMKQEEFKESVKNAGPMVIRAMKQNTTVNISEMYFDVRVHHQ